jgi:glutathione reductase (NADPH)
VHGLRYHVAAEAGRLLRLLLLRLGSLPANTSGATVLWSHIAAHAGAKVTVLQRRDRLLPHFDPDLVSWLMESFQRAGIEVRTEHVVEAIEKTASGFLVRARTQNGERAFEADLVVHAAGRIPDVDRLNLEAGQIERDEHGHLKLNEFLHSVSNPAVYAAGDAAAEGPPLTLVSSHDA